MARQTLIIRQSKYGIPRQHRPCSPEYQRARRLCIRYGCQYDQAIQKEAEAALS